MAEGKLEKVQLSKHVVDGSRDSYYDSHNAFYNMDCKYRGRALIFSHDIFDIKGLTPRAGNLRDWQRLEKCLKELSFQVDVIPNHKYSQIMKRIEKTAKMDHSENDCLLIVVLTHGESHGNLYARDTHYRAENLWSPFTDENCPSLAGKPRLFVIQACQGDNLDDGITLTRNYTETDGGGEWFDPHNVPFHRDFLVALSSVPGYYSWRNRDDGSWFIQSLCKQLEKSATVMDILTLLTFVSQKVALDFESSTKKYPHMNYKKIVPYFSSMLTRRLVFTKKYESDNNGGSTPRSDKSFVGLFKQCLNKQKK